MSLCRDVLSIRLPQWSGNGEVTIEGNGEEIGYGGVGDRVVNGEPRVTQNGSKRPNVPHYQIHRVERHRKGPCKGEKKGHGRWHSVEEVLCRKK